MKEELAKVGFTTCTHPKWIRKWSRYFSEDHQPEKSLAFSCTCTTSNRHLDNHISGLVKSYIITQHVNAMMINKAHETRT